jgi:hypothetical protein
VVLTFGDHRLDIARRELRRGADIIDLEPKAFDLQEPLRELALLWLVNNRAMLLLKHSSLRA